MIPALAQALAAVNGGPGLTFDELVEATRLPPVTVRAALGHAVFDEGAVTCVVPQFVKGATPEPGRYRLGDPTPLLQLQ